jgi:predicted phage terminase large subunit-like protein
MRGEGAGGRQDYFFTEEGGCVKAIGMGGITGFGAGKLREEFGGAIVIDDPLAAHNRRSPAERQNAIDYITGALKSRRNRQDDPPTPIVLIMQRLHPQDPAGRLLSIEREKWEVIQIPAHNEAGETIWPGRLNYEELMQIREADPATYFADYMQEPSDSMLTIFKSGWWKRWYNIQEVEKRITLKILTADTAFKAKDSSDFSVLQAWGIEGISGMHLIDQSRGQWEFPELLRNARMFIEKHVTPTAGITPASEFWVEDRASGQSLVQTLRREGLRVKEWLPDAKYPDKVARANQCTLPISAGRIFIPDSKMPGYHWVDGFVNECSAFSAELDYLHDDQVDTMTSAILIWLERGGGRGPLPIPF